MRTALLHVTFFILLAFALSGCAGPTPTPAPTATLLPPTATPVPPTATSVPSTATPVPPTATPVPPTATGTPTKIPPTATPVPSPTPRLFAPADLPKLVLQPSELPPQTENQPAFNRETNLDAFLGNPADADQFRAWGFQAMYLMGTKTVSPCNNVCSVFSWALLFKDADGAHKGLAEMERKGKAAYQNVKNLPLSGLSDDGYGLQGILASTGQEVIVYVWRVNNLVVSTHYNVKPGTVKPEDVLATAAKAHAHTK